MRIRCPRLLLIAGLFAIVAAGASRLIGHLLQNENSPTTRGDAKNADPVVETAPCEDVGSDNPPFALTIRALPPVRRKRLCIEVEVANNGQRHGLVGWDKLFAAFTYWRVEIDGVFADCEILERVQFDPTEMAARRFASLAPGEKYQTIVNLATGYRRFEYATGIDAQGRHTAGFAGETVNCFVVPDEAKTLRINFGYWRWLDGIGAFNRYFGFRPDDAKLPLGIVHSNDLVIEFH